MLPDVCQPFFFCRHEIYLEDSRKVDLQPDAYGFHRNIPGQALSERRGLPVKEMDCFRN